jgi:hypothetical protein
MNQQLLNRSRLIPIRECKNVNDSEQHFITFQTGSTRWKFHSKEDEHESSITGEALAAFYERQSRDARKVDGEFANDLFRKAAVSAEKVLVAERRKTRRRHAEQDEERPQDIEDIELLAFDPAQHPAQNVLRRTSQVLAVFFGVTLVLVGPEN